MLRRQPTFVTAKTNLHTADGDLTSSAVTTSYALYQSDDGSAQGNTSKRRQRLRLDGENVTAGNPALNRENSMELEDFPVRVPYSRTQPLPVDQALSPEGYSDSSDDEALAGAAGQLSLNEDEEVRYHGKVSGLYLLNEKRQDKRNEGGIWFVYFLRLTHFTFQC